MLTATLFKRLLFCGLALLMPDIASAQVLSLPNTPLFLTQQVKPNIILAIDDSGSMDSEGLYINNDGALWWKTDATLAPTTCPVGFVGCNSDGANDFADPTVLNFNTTGVANQTWKKFVYVFPNGTATGARVYNDCSTSHVTNGVTICDAHFAVPPIPALAWTRSPVYNKAYFDPSQTYTPWTNITPSTGTTTYGDSTPSAASSDPGRGSVTFDLTQDAASASAVAHGTDATSCEAITAADSAGYDFKVFSGMTLPVGTCAIVTRTYCNGKSGSSACPATQPTGDTCTNLGKSNAVCAGPRWTYFSNAVRVGTTDVADTTRGGPVADAALLPIRYFPATFYLAHGSSLPAGYGYTATPLTGVAYDSTTQLDGYQILSGNFSSTAAYNAAMKNFANWFTYYRKRHLAMRGGVGASFSPLTGIRVASFSINNRVNVTMKDVDTGTNKGDFIAAVYGGYVGTGGTPNREAVQNLGNQYTRTDSTAPIQYACQRNFGILFTDGYANASNLTAFGNADGDQGSPYADAVSNTMGDEAMYYFKNPLQSSSAFTAGEVNVPAQCSATSHDPSVDCNTNLHMNFYGVTIGTKGLVYGVNANSTSNPYTYPPTWPTSFQDRNPTAVDDLWHATINGRGKLFNATTPKDIASQFGSVLQSISQQTASASAVSLNSSSLNTGSLVFLASFNSASWSGDLTAYPISTGSSCGISGERIGDICSPQWMASTQLTSLTPSSRTILTYNPSTAAGIPFRWSNLTTTQQGLLNQKPDGSGADGYGSLRVNYLRGDNAQEATTASPQFRPRAIVSGTSINKLGDIIDSSPFYVGPPSFNYSFDGYTTFRSNNRNRTPVVYVGANDGMLHGFRVTDGREVLAYVPNKMYGTSSTPLLSGLTRTDFVHKNLVDGSPTVGDAYINSAWKSVLVGSLRGGGQGLFALDVTDPSTFAESNTGTVLWEFTDANDPDLGYTFSQPSIVRVKTGTNTYKWVAIVGNGYNNTEADGTPSTGTGGNSGKAVLFIIDLAGPGSSGWTLNTNYWKVVTNAGTALTPNGLATPAAVDTNGDGAIDYVYAGDQQGNMWRFNLNTGNPSTWAVDYGGSPLFVAKDAAGATQTITGRPEVGYNLNRSDPTNTSTPKLIVYFGTGRYIDASDNTQTGQQTQDFYGIFDDFGATAPSITRSNLLQQKVLTETTIGSNSFRTTTQSDYSDLTTQKGWYMDLYNTNNGAVTVAQAASGQNKGERQVTTPSLNAGTITFTTLIPSTDVCLFGGSGWTMTLNARNGAQFSTPKIDTNNSGTIDSSDTAVGGIGSTGGIPGGFGSLYLGGNLQRIYVPNSRGSIQPITGLASGRLGRITWREITP